MARRPTGARIGLLQAAGLTIVLAVLAALAAGAFDPLLRR